MFSFDAEASVESVVFSQKLLFEFGVILAV
jgi:hypothetical protein